MDIKRLIPTICLLGVFVWGGMKLKRSFMRVINIDVTQKEDTTGGLPAGLSRGDFGQYLRVGFPLPPSLESTGVSKECEPYVRSLASLDLMLFRDPSFHLNYQQLTEPNSSCSMTEDSVSTAETKYLKECFLNNPVKTDALNESCVHSLYDLRAMLTDMIYRNKKISEIESLPLLTELLYATFLKDGFSKAQRILDQILEVRSSFKAARKMSFYLQVQSAIETSKTKTIKDQDEVWSGLKKEFDQLRTQWGTDDVTNEYSAWIETRGYDPSLTSKYASSFLAGHPGSSWALFLSAYGHWLNDEHEESFRDLRKAVDLDPKNEDYQKVLDKIMTIGAGTESFNPGLKLGISLQDFDK